MTIVLSEELIEVGVKEQDVLNMYKAAGRRLYIEEISIDRAAFDALLREAYQEELDRGRIVELWSRWID